jgi:hypothetical protein
MILFALWEFHEQDTLAASRGFFSVTMGFNFFFASSLVSVQGDCVGVLASWVKGHTLAERVL